MLPLIAGSVCGFGAFLVLRSGVNIRETPVFGAVKLRLLTKSREDRRILGITDEEFVAKTLVVTVAGLCASTLTVLLSAGLGVRIPPFLSPIIVVCGTITSVGLFFESLGKKASVARQTFSYALSSYLDLASVLLAGGAGSETALNAAASTGKSWSFELIRGSLDGARAGRTSSWRVFADLGKNYGIVDLERLAGSMQLAGEQGARVRTSLAAQADALRTRQIAEIEADAQAATERMGVPTVLLFVGFIALLGYPALNLVVGQM
jgi:Flp pilus assembly protein TadB